MEPNNYSVNIPNPVNAFTNGLQSGALYNAIGAAKVQDAQQIQQAQAVQQAQDARQAALQKYISIEHPTASDVNAYTATIPKADADSIRASFELMTKEQQEAKLTMGGQVISALRSGNHEVAEKMLSQQAAAYRAAGNDEQAKAAEHYAQLAVGQPDFLAKLLTSNLPFIPGGDKVIDALAKNATTGREAALEPSMLEEAKAKAREATVKADYADSQAFANLEKTGWETEAIAEDINIRKDTNRIKELELNASKALQPLQKEKLQQEIDDAKLAREGKIHDKAAEVVDGRATMDNLLVTTDKLLKAPRWAVKRATGPIAGSKYFPTLTEGVANFEADLETLKAQIFEAKIPMMKGLGSLDKAEGSRLEKSYASLATTQKDEALLENIKTIQELTLKARTNLATKYGVPDTTPDTPGAGQGTSDTLPAIKGTNIQPPSLEDAVRHYQTPKSAGSRAAATPVEAPIVGAGADFSPAFKGGKVDMSDKGAGGTLRMSVLKAEYAGEMRTANDKTATVEARAAARRNLRQLDLEMRRGK